MDLSRFATDKYRWVALVFLSLGLSIVIIDNTVINVAIPYILRDLNTSFDAIQWVISGYALIIATVLITVGRLGDLYGRKKIFNIGIILFAIGSFIASIAPNVFWLFTGEAFIEAIGAAMMLTSSLALLVSEFQGKERAIAFGVWGSVAGASASIGPLLGGFLTTYYSWRWSLRINVLVAIIAILGTIFVKEAKGDDKKGFDWTGTVLSGAGLFLLVFGFIEGQSYGWWTQTKQFVLGSFVWPFNSFSVVPVAFILSLIILFFFVRYEHKLEQNGGSPLLKVSLFKNSGFSIALITLGIVVMGQFGSFIILPIFLQNVINLNALDTGLIFLWLSASMAVFGPLSGFVASKIGPKWVVSTGMFIGALGIYMQALSLSTTSTSLSLAPALIVLGIGFGMATAQLTNIVLSSVPIQYAGEASAVNATIRQVATSIGIAVIGTILAASVAVNVVTNIRSDNIIPDPIKEKVVTVLQSLSIEGGQTRNISKFVPPHIASAITNDVNNALVDASKNALWVAAFLNLLGAILSLFIPNTKSHH